MPSISKDNVDDETDQVLQAVILADSFNKRFKPLTIDRPKVSALCPFSLYIV
jgi:translation initiation factor eIF-2B subunit epsilon